MSLETSQILTPFSSSDENSNAPAEYNENEAMLDTDSSDSFREAHLQRSTLPDESLIQIRASTSEVKRRVAAFMASKKQEVVDNNVREFCFKLPDSEEGNDDDEQNSCARVDSVYVGRFGGSSRVNVMRVHSTQGPQIQFGLRGVGGPTSARQSLPSMYKDSVEERISNAEQHLGIASNTKADLFSRLKAVEEGIVFLNGLSPEYFNRGKLPQPKIKHTVPKPEPSPLLPEKQSTTKIRTEYDNISDIDQRILALRRKLKKASVIPDREESY